jgi:putative addiction module component (TIGR02574 family)
MALMGDPVVDLDDLSPEQQLELLGELWDRLSQRPAAVPLTPEQREELDRRLDGLEDNIRAGRPLGRPWSDVREQFRPK